MKCLPIFTAALFAMFAAGQQDPPKTAPKVDPNPPAKAQDPQQLMQEVLQKFQKEGIELDAKAMTLTIKAFVNQPQDPIEYLLIHRRGKKHEAMFYTKSQPSVLNAALLMLGLQPGQNAGAEDIKPPPSIEEIEKGAETVKITPPKGMPFWMTVKWKTPEGQAVEYCIEDLLLDLSTQKPVVDASWIYLGGRLAKFYKDDPEVFAADMEGNLISVCYMYPDNHLGTLSHKDARDQHNWWLTNKVPEPDTEVQFVFHRQQPQLHKDREERLKKEAAAAAKQAAEGKPGEAGKDAPKPDEPKK